MTVCYHLATRCFVLNPSIISQKNAERRVEESVKATRKDQHQHNNKIYENYFSSRIIRNTQKLQSHDIFIILYSASFAVICLHRLDRDSPSTSKKLKQKTPKSMNNIQPMAKKRTWDTTMWESISESSQTLYVPGIGGHSTIHNTNNQKNWINKNYVQNST